MNNSEKYNGHANYETWLFNLYHQREHFENDIEYIIENASKTEYLSKEQIEVKMLEETIEDYLQSLSESGKFAEYEPFFFDFINASIKQIDFREIAENYIDEYKQENKEL